MIPVKQSGTMPSKDGGKRHVHPQPNQEEIPSGNDATERDFITVQDVANRLSLSTRTVYRMLDAGDIPHTNLGRNRRIPTLLFDRWVADRIADAEGTQRQRKAWLHNTERRW